MSSGHASESLDKFALWFLTAFGAGLALLISHLKEVSDFIPLPTMAAAAYLFLFAAVVCVAQRYVAMVITSGVASAKEGVEMGTKLEGMDVEEFFVQMQKGFPRPLRGLCQGQYTAILKGDFAVTGRIFIRLTMLQGALVTVELVVLLVALAKIVTEIGV